MTFGLLKALRVTGILARGTSSGVSALVIRIAPIPVSIPVQITKLCD